MICLTCQHELSGSPPLKCAGCGTLHDSRPPVVGVNHFSQVLAALDLFADEEIEAEAFESIFFAFVDQLESLDQKWQFRERLLSERLAPALKEKFGAQVTQYEEAIQLGFQGVEWVEAILAGESDDFESAENCLVGFFRGVCAASASLLDNLEQLESSASPGGALFNLPSV